MVNTNNDYIYIYAADREFRGFQTTDGAGWRVEDKWGTRIGSFYRIPSGHPWAGRWVDVDLIQGIKGITLEEAVAYSFTYRRDQSERGWPGC